MTLQERIDNLTYPPTHTYNLVGMEPTDVLKKRIEVIKRVAPSFFTSCLRFLDVGCNK